MYDQLGRTRILTSLVPSGVAVNGARGQLAVGIGENLCIEKKFVNIMITSAAATAR